ncbi:hypothetical protein ACV1D9_19485 [Aeromonas allosaccharophila]
MTTTAAGDAAVARLNKATEAFEKIITGASNQVVDVPGYGNQPTLAARVDERFDETTATAAAEANRSRDEADRSRDEANRSRDEANRSRTEAESSKLSADRAAQITGLDTVSDAVALAALPLPDVWAPLTDDLRLISGYGREVKVGDDVVAKMFGFSRASTATYIGKDGKRKAAAANEPRFEKYGLLIEVQSTNFIPRSAVLESQNIPVQAGSHTLSFHGLGSVTLSGAASGVLVGTGETDRVALTVTAATGGLTLTVSGLCTDAQLEPIPLATSYIPTSGAAVTRAADNLTGLGPGNIPIRAPFSLAAEISVTPVVGAFPIVISMGGLRVEMAEPVAGSHRLIPFLNLSPSVPWLQGSNLFGGRQVLAISCDSSGMLLRYGGKTNSGIGGQIETVGDIDVSYIGVCHIRNFRIWHRALTDEQIKGVA